MKTFGRLIATMEDGGVDTGGVTAGDTPDDHGRSRFEALTVIATEGKFLR